MNTVLQSIARELLKSGTYKKVYTDANDVDEHLNAIDQLVESGYCTIRAQAIGFVELNITDLGKQALEELL